MTPAARRSPMRTAGTSDRSRRPSPPILPARRSRAVSRARSATRSRTSDLAREPARLADVEDPEALGDEPTSALDVTVQAEVLELLRGLRDRERMSVLFISHDLAVVAELCDRVAIMRRGSIVEQGPTSQVISAPASPYTAELLASVPRLAAGAGQ